MKRPINVTRAASWPAGLRAAGKVGGLVAFLALCGCAASPPAATPTPPAARVATSPAAQPAADLATPASAEATPSGPSSMDRYLEQRKKDNRPRGRTDPIR